MKNTPEIYKQGQDWFDAHYISSIEVEEKYNVSRQQQRNLYSKGQAPDALYIGATLFYWRDTAEPWFKEYDQRQKGRIKNSEERKEKKARGRPRKARQKDEWRNTVFNGWEINIPEEFESAEKWVAHVHREQMAKYKIPPAYGSPEHKEWVATWKALKQHFNIYERSIC